MTRQTKSTNVKINFQSKASQCITVNILITILESKSCRNNERNIHIILKSILFQFSGTWFEAARFPSELQRGECAAKTITSSLNTLTINETYVDNERLNTINVRATISADGRGVLNATLTDTTGSKIENNSWFITCPIK